MNFSQFEKKLAKFIIHRIYSSQAVYDTIEYIIKLLTPLNIRVNYEPTKNAVKRKSTKVILSSLKERCDMSIPLVRYCNGLVLSIYKIGEHMGFKVLAVPPGDFDVIGKKHTINLEDYKIFIAKDGTTITYYYDKIWRLSTKNGYDVGNLIWRGTSFSKAVNETLSHYNFSLDKLNKNKSYTFGFRHPSHHPFMPNHEAWIINTYNIEKKKWEPNNADMGLPHQKQTYLKNVDSMYNTCNMALTNYLNGETPRFGFVLRAKWGINYYMESTLMAAIRRMIYNFPMGKMHREEYLYEKACFGDINYVVLLNYLNFVENETFIKLFPQYQSLYDKFDAVTNECTQMIQDPNVEGSDEAYQLSKVLTQKVSNLCKFNGKIDKKDRDNIISDLIKNPKYISIYWGILF